MEAQPPRLPLHPQGFHGQGYLSDGQGRFVTLRGGGSNALKLVTSPMEATEWRIIACGEGGRICCGNEHVMCWDIWDPRRPQLMVYRYMPTSPNQVWNVSCVQGNISIEHADTGKKVARGLVLGDSYMPLFWTDAKSMQAIRQQLQAVPQTTTLQPTKRTRTSIGVVDDMDDNADDDALSAAVTAGDLVGRQLQGTVVTSGDYVELQLPQLDQDQLLRLAKDYAAQQGLSALSAWKLAKPRSWTVGASMPHVTLGPEYKTLVGYKVPVTLGEPYHFSSGSSHWVALAAELPKGWSCGDYECHLSIAQARRV